MSLLKGKGNFLIWTIVALLALVFFYTFSSNRLYKVKIIGNEDFKKSVLAALGSLHMRFEVVGDSEIVFDQNSRVCLIKGKVFHLWWNDKVIKDAIDGVMCENCSFLPVVNGKIDRNMVEIMKDCGRIIRGSLPKYFQDGWLVVKIAVFGDDKLLFIYDPLAKTREYLGGGEGE